MGLGASWGLLGPLDASWIPLGRLLYVTPTKVTVLCYVYISISSNPPKNGHVLTQWTLVPLGNTIICNNNKSNSLIWCWYIKLQLPTNNWPGIISTVIVTPWTNSYQKHQIKEQSSVILKYEHPVTNLRNLLDANQFIDDGRSNLKTGNLATTFHKPARGEICMFSLDMARWNLYNTHEDKFKY